MKKLFYLLCTATLLADSTHAQNLKMKATTGNPTQSISKLVRSFNGYIAAGLSGAFGSRDILLAKYDNDLNLVWRKTIGNNQDNIPYDFMETSTHQLLFCFIDTFGSKNRLNLVKLDEQGNHVWTRSIEPAFSSYGILERPDKQYAFVYLSTASLNNTQIAFSILDTLGNILSTTSIHQPSGADGLNLFNISNDRIELTGSDSRTQTTVNSLINIKCDAAGNVLQGKMHSRTNIDFAPSRSCKTSDGGTAYLSVGWNSSGSGVDSYYVCRLDSGANALWLKSYYAPEQVVFNHCAAGTRGNVYLTGTIGPNTNLRTIIAEMDASGNVVWTKIIPARSSPRAIIYDAATNSAVIATNYFDVSGTINMPVMARTIMDSTADCGDVRYDSVYTRPSSFTSTTTNFTNASFAPTLLTLPVLTGTTEPVTDSLICSIVGIKDVAMPVSFSLYPNPATYEITVTTPLSGNTTLQILDMTCRQVYTCRLTKQQTTLPLNLQSGLYLVRIVSGNNRAVQKLIVR